MRNTSPEQDYQLATEGSAAWEQRGRAVMPIAGSRAVSFHRPYPLTMDRGEGAFLYDVDGNRYVDLAANMFSLVHGNAYPPIVAAATAQLARGTAWPANNAPQIELAETLVARLPAIERILFCNSGTEAFSLALNISRGRTGRYRFLMAAAGYHGTMWDTALGGKGGEGPTHLAAPYGDTEAFLAVIERHGHELAAVFLEPMLGSGGFALPPAGFLRAVYDACQRNGIVFVLDEVVTFRLALGGLQASLDFQPDLVLLGKIIGGGFPVGGVGGKAEILAVVDPQAPRALASGTFSGNPVTMAAGLASVTHLTAAAIAHIDALAAQLEAGFKAEAASRGIRLFTRRVGSLLAYFFYDPGAGPVAMGSRPDTETIQRLHLAMLSEGLFPLPRAAVTTSTVMTGALVAEVVQGFGRALSRLQDSGGIAA